jgi:hypothetical protein
MALAYLVGAMASGFTAAGLTALLVWIGTVLSGSGDAWAIAPWLIAAAGLVVAAATSVAEGIAHRRSLERMRSSGEPWAYRPDR